MTSKEFEQRLCEMFPKGNFYRSPVKSLILDLIGENDSIHGESQEASIISILAVNNYKDKLRKIVKGE